VAGIDSGGLARREDVEDLGGRLEHVLPGHVVDEVLFVFPGVLEPVDGVRIASLIQWDGNLPSISKVVLELSGMRLLLDTFSNRTPSLGGHE
jgi:hypothetical protein